MAHLEKTGHQDDPAIAEALKRAVSAMQEAQAMIKPPRQAKVEDDGSQPADG